MLPVRAADNSRHWPQLRKNSDEVYGGGLRSAAAACRRLGLAPLLRKVIESREFPTHADRAGAEAAERLCAPLEKAAPRGRRSAAKGAAAELTANVESGRASEEEVEYLLPVVRTLHGATARVCHGCWRPLEGGATFVVAPDGWPWHDACFDDKLGRCSGCREVISRSFDGSSDGVQANDGKPWHRACHEAAGRARSERTCAGCGEVISGSYIPGPAWDNKKSWHPKCYQEKHAKRCSSCGKIITESYVKGEGAKQWHPACYQEKHAMRCAGCAGVISPGSSYLMIGKIKFGTEQQPWHQACHEEKYPPARCTGCAEVLSGAYILVGNEPDRKPWHSSCFEGRRDHATTIATSSTAATASLTGPRSQRQPPTTSAPPRAATSPPRPPVVARQPGASAATLTAASNQAAARLGDVALDAAEQPDSFAPEPPAGSIAERRKRFLQAAASSGGARGPAAGANC